MVVRGPFPGPGGSGPMSNMPPFPPAMLALMNGGNPNGGPPPMRFAGPPILNQHAPPHQHGFGNMPNGSSGPPPPPPQSQASNGPPLIGGMNPERARQLGLL